MAYLIFFWFRTYTQGQHGLSLIFIKICLLTCLTSLVGKVLPCHRYRSGLIPGVGTCDTICSPGGFSLLTEHRNTSIYVKERDLLNDLITCVSIDVKCLEFDAIKFRQRPNPGPSLFLINCLVAAFQIISGRKTFST